MKQVIEYKSYNTLLAMTIDNKNTSQETISTTYYIHSDQKTMHSRAIQSMTPSHTSKHRDPEIHNLQKFRDLQINGILLDCERRNLQESKKYE
jgi:hypothetical protein